MSTDIKNAVINVRVPGDIKKQLQELADKDRRSLSDFIVLKLENILKGIKKG